MSDSARGEPPRHHSPAPIAIYVEVPRASPVHLDRLVHAVLVFVIGYFWYTLAQKIDVFATGTSWSFFATFGTQRQLATVFAVLFIVSVVTWSSNIFWMRAVGSTLMSLVHMAMALMFYLGNPHGTAFGPYFGYAVLAAAITWKAAHDQARSGGRLATARPQGQLAG